MNGSSLRPKALAATAFAVALVLGIASCGGDTNGESPAAEAFRRLIEMTSDGQYGPAWEMLHPAQQALISKDDFVECSAKQGDVELEIVSFKDEYEETLTLPGTDLQVETVALTFELRSGMGTDTMTMHLMDLDGEWRWAVADPADFDPETC